jgi:hypothetical protein
LPGPQFFGGQTDHGLSGRALKTSKPVGCKALFEPALALAWIRNRIYEVLKQSFDAVSSLPLRSAMF